MTLRGRADIITNLTDESNGIDMSNHTAFSTRCKILVDGKEASDSGGSFESGTFDLIRELFSQIPVSAVYRHERYVIDFTYKLVDQSNEVNAREMLEEIDRVLVYYSYNTAHDYEFSFSLEADRGEIFATGTIVYTKKFVDRSG